jgi:hypothetical protein
MLEPHFLERRAGLVHRKVLESNLATKHIGWFDPNLLMIHLDRTFRQMALGKTNGGMS